MRGHHDVSDDIPGILTVCETLLSARPCEVYRSSKMHLMTYQALKVRSRLFEPDGLWLGLLTEGFALSFTLLK